ncbi:MAG: putative sporulation protein YtxC [Clostridiales bacterium]|jgi:putative sporulation protein YtxC|nr:putative sporulation protein YtxC [Clostridiales bacterium]
MECLRIGVNKDTKGFAEKILDVIKENDDNIDLKYKKNTKKNKLIYLDVFFKNKHEKIVKTKFENVTSDWIIKKYEKKIIYDIINKKYNNLSFIEKNEVLIDIMKKIENGKDVNLSKRRGEIKNKISEYLETSDKLFIDGFVRFRLKEYWIKLEEIVEENVSKYVLNKEYEDFISLLQYFVHAQKPKLNILHVIVKKDGTYSFYDKLLMDITQECKNEFVNELITKKINYDDLLISALIVFSPKKIILHNVNLIKNKELLTTIIKVFDKKIKFCNECKLCKNN